MKNALRFTESKFRIKPKTAVRWLNRNAWKVAAGYESKKFQKQFNLCVQTLVKDRAND